MKTRAVNVHKTDEYDVLVDRGSPWGNWCGGRTATERVAAHRAMLLSRPDLVERARPDLEGKVLGCHCIPRPCHAINWADAMNRAGEFE